MHVGGHGSGPVQGDERGDVIEGGRGQRPHEGAHRPALELEHADGVAPPQHGQGGGVVERQCCRCRAAPPGPLDEIEGELDDVEVAQAEEIHLEQAQLFHPVHLVLGDDGGVLDPARPLRACAGSAGTR